MKNKTTQQGKAVKTFSRIFQFLIPHRMKIFSIFTILIVETVLKLFSPWIFGRVINIFWQFKKGGYSLEFASGELIWHILLLTLFYTGAWICRTGISYITVFIGNNVLYEMRKNFFSAVQKFSLKFFNKYNTGEIISRLINDTSVINNTLNTAAVNFFRNIFFLCGIIIAMAVLNFRLTAITSIVLLLMVISTIFFSRKIRSAHRTTRETLSQLNSELVEDISGIRVSQAFNRQKKNIHNFRKVNNSNRKASVNVASLYSFVFPIYNVINYTGVALILIFGGHLFIHDLISLGMIMTFVQYIEKFFYPIKSLSSLWFNIQSGIAAGDHIYDFLDTSQIIPEKKNPAVIETLKGKVEFKSVDFEYIKNKKVLKNINFTANPGRKTAIIGPTGAGKTTILNLILRFYDVTRGTIYIDGHDIRDISLECLRSQIGIVLQDTALFSQSIMENIRYGTPGASDRMVIETAKQANAHGFISRLPEGYGTMVREGGNNLSRGERQLLSIARAILCDPRILILDEATSSVDTKTERLIQRAIEQLLEGRTSFIVAHRLSTIQNADTILVLKEGAIIERGTHEELLLKKGEYYKIY